MKITISLRGALTKYFDGKKERIIEVPDGCTAEEALRLIGIDWKQIKNFGFVAINSKKVMMNETLKEGDELKAYPRISGG
jgi:molybdopterin converting factor small subunit